MASSAMALSGKPALLTRKTMGQFPRVSDTVAVAVPLNSKIECSTSKRRVAHVASVSSSYSIPLKLESRFGSFQGGAGLLERPGFDQSQFDPSTQVEEGGDIGRLRETRATRSGDSYRVLLLDDERHTENLVTKVLPQAVPSVTPDDARKLFHESRKNGVAIVIVTVKEHAEFYSEMMIRGGLRSSIEPDSNTA